jgi:hypothetical protein
MDVNSKAVEVMEHASLEEVSPQCVGAKQRNMKHVHDAVGKE